LFENCIGYRRDTRAAGLNGRLWREIVVMLFRVIFLGLGCLSGWGDLAGWMGLDPYAVRRNVFCDGSIG
ncbi:hypothetical protein, partial [Dongia mobilis]|uniref:hypothetical protein n=1 Tax=Dongia mobilis TaxID=578943 RepID=UPI001AAD10F1